jgi:hypothetical protein
MSQSQRITKFLWPQSLCTQSRVVELVPRLGRPSLGKILIVKVSPARWLVLRHTIQYLFGLTGVGGRMYLEQGLHWRSVVDNVVVIVSYSTDWVSIWGVLWWSARLAWHMVWLGCPISGLAWAWLSGRARLSISLVPVPFRGVAAWAVLHYVAHLSTLHTLSPASPFFT